MMTITGEIIPDPRAARYTPHVSWLTPEYRATAERYAPRFGALSAVCLLMVLMAWLGISLRGLEREQHPNALQACAESLPAQRAISAGELVAVRRASVRNCPATRPSGTH
jgi:hypothetical protein